MKLEADIKEMEIAPDTLSLFWPGHPVAVPIKGTVETKGIIGKSMALTMSIASSAGNVSAKGTYNQTNKSLNLDGDLTNFSASELLTYEIPVSGMTGNISFTYEPNKKMEGQAPVRHINAKMGLTQFYYEGVKSFPMNGEIDFLGDTFAGSIFSESPGTDMTFFVSGKSGENFEVLVRGYFRDLDPARVADGLPKASLAGTVGLEGSGNSLDTFKGKGKLSLQPTELVGYNISEASLTYVIANGRINFKDVGAKVEGVSLSGSGWVDFINKGTPFNFKARADLDDPEKISEWTSGSIIAQSIMLNFELKGTKNSFNLKGEGEAVKIELDPFKTDSADFTIDVSGKGDRVSGEIMILAKSVVVPSVQYNEFNVPFFDMWIFTTIEPSKLSSPP